MSTVPLSNEVWTLLKGPTVLAEMERGPTQEPGKIADRLFAKSSAHTAFKDSAIGETRRTQSGETDVSPEDIERAVESLGYSRRPSDLFLKVYAATLKTLENNPLVDLVSPPLIASTGVIPLSIISVIPDIVHHMADVIVQAESEVFLATNYWEASSAAEVITNAIRELNRRAGERGGKIIFKLMYDRGSLRQIFENHVIVPPHIYTGDAVKLPPPEDIPNIDLEVMNYHRPVLGTFHSKFMIVDRKIALLQSNNIQDRVNMEMMTHIEGPIVQGIYEMALLSWHVALSPPLPLLSCPPPLRTSYQFGDENKYIRAAATDTRKAKSFFREHQGTPEEGQVENKTGPELPQDYTSEQLPAAAVISGNGEGETTTVEKSPEANPKGMTIAEVTKLLNTNLQPDTVGDVPDDPDSDEFRPYILHAPHEPVPMVLVNRKPRGSVTPGGVNNPQDEAWLTAIRYAERTIFIQTPTFNAAPVVEAILAAARRGVECTLYLDLGFNDAGENLPMQGGTNEMVVSKIYKELEEEHKKNLKVYWYTGKDQSRPIGASAKKRNCHVKIMIVDDQIGIQGNGNQDTQSWFHSQEVNILVDSPAIVKEWAAGIDANQNTRLHGQVEYDGVWRDREGKPLVDAVGSTDRSIFSTLKGVGGAIARVRGTGGF